MMNTAKQTQEIIINQNSLYRHIPTGQHSPQRNEIDQLRRRIRDLEEELLQTRQDLAQERRHANIDPLTNIPNRRAYQKRLQLEQLRSLSDSTPLCLIIWDIDHFKSINDRYGHQTGDMVLACVAKKISHRLRKSDFTARFGGEEFVSILPDCDTTDAMRLAETLRTEISSCEHKTDRDSLQLTISCGIAEFDPNENAATLFNRADTALYRAKQQGRNQTCLAG